MGDRAIVASGVGKQYTIGKAKERHDTLRDAMTAAVSRSFGRLRSLEFRSEPERFWALRDVSFELKRGETLGIIGPNGAGKSTLLKILSRITEPTTGQIAIRGRVGCLLEVGTGFHSELTGRENIFLNGAILGMTRSEIERKFNEIVDFAEVDRFIDTPVKHYSSGMHLRLGFAVAAHLEPEILIVDEVLAVGDAKFQRKCVDKMGEVARAGRTVLFVSHNTIAIESLCDRAIRLDDGQVVDDGVPGAVIARYLQSTFATSQERTWPDCREEQAHVRLRRIAARPSRGTTSDPIHITTPFVLEFDVENRREGSRIRVSFSLRDEQDVLLFDICPPPETDVLDCGIGILRTTCHLPADLFNDGVYRVSVLILIDGAEVVEVPDALIFPILDSPEQRRGWYGKWRGALRPVFDWETNRPLGGAKT